MFGVINSCVLLSKTIPEIFRLIKARLVAEPLILAAAGVPPQPITHFTYYIGCPIYAGVHLFTLWLRGLWWSTIEHFVVVEIRQLLCSFLSGL